MSGVKVTPMDPQSMFQLTTYTDDKAGTIFEKMPVVFSEDDGEFYPDPLRQPGYSGQTTVTGPAGSQQLTFPIPAKNLQEAIKNFAPAVEGVISEIQSNAIQKQILEGGGRLPANGRVLIDQPSRKR